MRTATEGESMNRIAEIEWCPKCPHIELVDDDPSVGAPYFECQKEGVAIDFVDGEPFPEWCPLPKARK